VVYENLVKRVEAFLGTRLPCLGDYARPIATILVLCFEWGAGDALAGYMLSRIVASSRGDIAERIVGILEQRCNAKIAVRPPAHASHSHTSLCLYLEDVFKHSDFGDQLVNRFFELWHRYATSGGGTEALKEIDRILESIGAKKGEK